MKKLTLTLNMLTADKAADDFMHAAGVFEDFKRLVEVSALEMDWEGEGEPKYAAMIESLRKGMSDRQFVTAMWFANKPEIHYVDWSVRMISNGKNWAMLDDYLKQFGITRPTTVK